MSPFQETNIQGVFACGDNRSMMRAVANAVYTGGVAGAIVNGRLVEEKLDTTEVIQVGGIKQVVTLLINPTHTSPKHQ